MAIVGAAFGGMLFFMISDALWLPALLPLAILAYLIYLAFSTFYSIDGEYLIVECGFWKKKVGLSRIRKVQDSADWSSAPAISIDRIEILYDRFETIVISPKNKAGFVNALLEAKPDLEVNVKHLRENARRTS